MVGRTPANIVASNPLCGGVIADFDTAKLMLQHFVRKKDIAILRLLSDRIGAAVTNTKTTELPELR